MKHLCYTDGSCKKSEGAPGGWGVHIRFPDGTTQERYGSAAKTHNTTMELTAILEALRALPEGARAEVFSDSRTALEYCGKRIPIWRKNGWKSVDPQHLGLLQSIDAQLTEKSLHVEWTWVRAHNGNFGNERADDLAARGAREAKAAQKQSR